jgi:hypothetical protein
MSEKLWRIAAAGNCAALVIVLVVLASAGTLFGTSAASRDARPVVRPAASAPARVVLIVLDAVRDDLARDGDVMPRLVALRRAGSGGTAMVESLVPSTVAGIRVLATGQVPAPASFVEDFGARPAPHGGMFEALRKRGGRVFVAGPALWLDLYGKWIDDAEVVTTFRDDDARVVAAAARAIRARVHDLVVVHLGACDDLAHRHGARSEAYRAGLRAYDRAVGLLLDAMDADTAVIVTTDHGVTAGGGHAGPEPEVLRTPFVAGGPGFPPRELGAFPQREVARIVAAALGVTLDRAASGDPDPAAAGQDAGPVGAAVPGSLLLLAVAGLGVPGAVIVLSRVAARAPVARDAIVLDAALWTSILVGALGTPLAALAVAGGALGAVALRLGRWPAPLVPAAAWIPLGGAIDAVTIGGEHLALTGTWNGWRTGSTLVLCVLAALSLFRAWRVPGAHAAETTVGRARGIRAPGLVSITGLLALTAACALVGGASLAAVALAALGLGHLLGSILERGATRAAAPAGAAAVCIAVLLPRLLGETVSLSTIDVRAAVRVVDFPFGPGLAVLVVVLRHAVTTLALLAGLAPGLRRVPPECLGALVAGAAAVCVGQTLATGAALALSAGSVTLGSLALGSLVRGIAEVTALFLGAAVVMAVSGGRPVRTSRARDGSAPPSTRGSASPAPTRGAAPPAPCAG